MLLCLGLVACATAPPPVAEADGPGPVCAVKLGERQSYWNAAAARRDGALVVLAGECPPRADMDGGGGMGGM